MSNSWGKKLATKVNSLGESSSKESIQTLAKWIGFNRKHAATAFVPVLCESLLQAKSAALQTTRLAVLHEVLILDKDNSTKWDKMEELRLHIGEGVLLKVAPQLQEPAREKIKTAFLKEWDETNSFGGPSVINQLKKIVSNKPSVETSPTTAAEAPSKPEKETPEPPAEMPPQAKDPLTESTPLVAMKESEDATLVLQHQEESAPASTNKTIKTTTDAKKVTLAKPIPATTKTTTIVSPAAAATYDFEASGIAAEKVDPKDLLEPTRTIASLQIARDLRNDGAVQLSSLLSGLPDNIKESWDNQEELSADKARDYAMRTPDVLIDMDLEEQLQSIRMYRDIVKRQRAARKQLIIALIRSRCQFGAQEAAQGFENADRAREQLLKRKQVLMDAMELEGLDVTEEEKNLYSGDATEFAPLQWYKKARTDE